MPGCNSIVSKRPWYHKFSHQTFSCALWFVQGSRTIGAKAVSKAPTRTLRRPLKVRLKWSSDVAPSLCDRVVMSCWPHQTCASMAPKCPRLRIAVLRILTSQGMSAASGSFGSTSRFKRSNLVSTAVQHLWLTSRKHSRKASNRRGARLSPQMLAARGTKAFASVPQLCTLCQSAFSRRSPSPPSSNLQVAQRPWISSLWPRRGGQGSTRPAKGPSGSSRKKVIISAAQSFFAERRNTEGARRLSMRPP
mmetsp:Transcript_125217/g.365714  ORF Transcript_125217/g.365714 Transcript_125217/m.365714 type:complete len:249 (-) Transcript_125217:224-970(-)